MTRTHPPSATVSSATVVALLAALLAAGCATARPVLLPETLRLQTWHESGRPLLDIAPPDDEPATPDRAPPLSLRVYALEQTPVQVLQPLTTAAGMVTRPDVPVPLRAVPGPARGVRLGVDEADTLLDDVEQGRWGAHALVEERVSLLVPGGTTYLGVWVEPPLDVDPDGRPVRVGFAFGAAGAGDEPLGVTLRVVQGHPPERTGLDDEFSPTVLRVSREVAHWSPEAEVPTTLAAVVPSPFGDDRAAAFLVLATVSSPPTAGAPGWDEHVARFEAARRAMVAAAKGPAAPGLMLARRGLLDDEHSRSALVFLSEQTNTRFARDVALAAPDEAIASYAGAVLEHWPVVPPEQLQQALGAVLVRAAYSLVADHADAGTLTRSLQGVLLLYAGEVGRHPALLREILANAATMDALAEQVIGENLGFLRDSSPAARVRAYDWLLSLDRAPPDYDPLAPREERKAALRAFEEQEHAP